MVLFKLKGYNFFSNVDEYGRNKLKKYTHKQSKKKIDDCSLFCCYGKQQVEYKVQQR